MKKLLALLIAVLITAPAFAHWPKRNPVEQEQQDETTASSASAPSSEEVEGYSVGGIVQIQAPMTDEERDRAKLAEHFDKKPSYAVYTEKEIEKDASRFFVQNPYITESSKVASKMIAESLIKGMTKKEEKPLAEELREEVKAKDVEKKLAELEQRHKAKMLALKKEVEQHEDYSKAKDAYMAWETGWEKAREFMAKQEVENGECDGSDVGICQYCLSDVSRELDSVREKYYELKAVSAPIAKMVSNLLYDDIFTTKNAKGTITLYTVWSYFYANNECMVRPYEDDGFWKRMDNWKDEIYHQH